VPVLSNPRHERFAQGIAKGKSQHDAYIYAGYKGLTGAKNRDKDCRSNAGHLARTPQIAARIAELLERQAKRVDVTVDGLLVELNGMLMLAKRVKAPGAGVSAIVAKAKLLGLITDKVDTSVNFRKPARQPTAETQLSLDDWKAKFFPDDDSDRKGPVQ